jgi:hypothetical protein
MCRRRPGKVAFGPDEQAKPTGFRHDDDLHRPRWPQKFLSAKPEILAAKPAGIDGDQCHPSGG